MFNRKVPNTDTLDIAIDKAFEDLKNYPADSDEYAAIMKHVDQLYIYRYPNHKKGQERKPVDVNVVIPAVASLFGVGMIIGFEKANVLTSKALSFVVKPKL